MVSLNSFISTTTLNGAVLPPLLDLSYNILMWNVSPLLVSSTAQLLFTIGVLAIRQTAYNKHPAPKKLNPYTLDLRNPAFGY